MNAIITIMKTRIALKSLNDLSLEILKPETDKPVPATPEPNSTVSQERDRVLVPLRQREHADSTGYRHWGINE